MAKMFAGVDRIFFLIRGQKQFWDVLCLIFLRKFGNVEAMRKNEVPNLEAEAAALEFVSTCYQEKAFGSSKYTQS